MGQVHLTGPSSRKMSDSERIFCLGEGVYLFANSPRHHGYSVAQLTTFLFTPIKLDQFRIYRHRSGPMGFVAWAYLSDEVAAGYASGRRELTAADWQSGRNIWIIEFVAPFGRVPEIVTDLRCNIFAGQRGWAIRREGPSGTPRVIELLGTRQSP